MRMYINKDGISYRHPRAVVRDAILPVSGIASQITARFYAFIMRTKEPSVTKEDYPGRICIKIICQNAADRSVIINSPWKKKGIDESLF
jgi:hypothetical protein